MHVVNLSQQLNSLYWEKINHGATTDECKELYDDIAKLAVLSGIEIDKAKREFVIDSGREIETLKKKYRIVNDNKTVKPLFFKMITTENGYELSDSIYYRAFETPMDYLQKIIASTNFRQARQYKIDVIPFMDIVKRPNNLSRGGYAKISKDKIIIAVRQAKDDIKRLYIDYQQEKFELFRSNVKK